MTNNIENILKQAIIIQKEFNILYKERLSLKTNVESFRNWDKKLQYKEAKERKQNIWKILYDLTNELKKKEFVELKKELLELKNQEINKFR